MSSFPSGLSKFWSLWSSRYLFPHKWQSSHLGRPSAAINSGSWREVDGSRMLPFLFSMSLVLGTLCIESSGPGRTAQIFVPMRRKVVSLLQYSQGNHLCKEGKTSCSSPQRLENPSLPPLTQDYSWFLQIRSIQGVPKKASPSFIFISFYDVSICQIILNNFFGMMSHIN